MQKSIIFFVVATIFIANSRALYEVQSVEDFDSQVKKADNKLVVVEFFATWCAPCNYISKYLEIYNRKYAGKIVVLKVDVDQFEELALIKYGVKSMPTFVFLKNGKVAQKFSGANASRIERTIIQMTKV